MDPVTLASRNVQQWENQGGATLLARNPMNFVQAGFDPCFDYCFNIPAWSKRNFGFLVKEHIRPISKGGIFLSVDKSFYSDRILKQNCAGREKVLQAYELTRDMDEWEILNNASILHLRRRQVDFSPETQPFSFSKEIDGHDFFRIAHGYLFQTGPGKTLPQNKLIHFFPDVSIKDKESSKNLYKTNHLSMLVLNNGIEARASRLTGHKWKKGDWCVFIKFQN